MAISCWQEEWNYIIRNVIFSDMELRKLMMIPDGTNIIDFIDKFFIRAGDTNETLKSENVRIVYGDIPVGVTNNPNVVRTQMKFNIYVKKEHLHDVSNDRLVLRTMKICDRLNLLLAQPINIKGYRFRVIGEQDIGTRTIGYVRRDITFEFKKVYG